VSVKDKRDEPKQETREGHEIPYLNGEISSAICVPIEYNATEV